MNIKQSFTTRTKVSTVATLTAITTALFSTQTHSALTDSSAFSSANDSPTQTYNMPNQQQALPQVMPQNPTFQSYTPEQYKQVQQNYNTVATTQSTDPSFPNSYSNNNNAVISNNTMTKRLSNSADRSSIQNMQASPSVVSLTNATSNMTNNSSTYGIDKQVNAYIVRTVGGQEQMMPVVSNTKLQQGDTLEYQVQVRNVGQDRIGSMLVNLSIPSEVEFLDYTYPQQAMGSLDGASFYYIPVKSRVNGVLQAVALNKYKALRWKVENLNMDETTMVRYRARVK